MKTGRKRGVCLFLAACVLWGMVGVLPVAAAGEATSLEGATISFEKPSFKYTRSPIEPKITVALKGKNLYEGVHYTVSYQDNINAGTATVIITG